MLRSYVCRQCRSQLRQRVASPRNPQWQQPRATFLSLRNGQPQPESQPQSQPKPSPGESHSPPSQHVPPRERKPLGRYSRYGQLTGQHLDALSTEAGAQHAHAHADAHADATPFTSPAQTIDALLSKRSDRATEQAWYMFLEHYGSRASPAFTNPSNDDIPHLTGGKVFTRLSRSMTIAFCNTGNRNPNPKNPATPTEVLFKYEQVGIGHYEHWRNSIGYLTDQLLWGVCGTAASNKRTPDAILQELVNVWRAFFQCKGVEPDALESISPEWKNVPDVSTLTGRHQDARFGIRMSQYHPNSPSGVPLQFSAVTLFNLFDEVNQAVFKVPESLRVHAAPLIRLITFCLAKSNVQTALKHEGFSISMQALPADFREAVMDQVRSAPAQAMRVLMTQPNRRSKESREAAMATPTANPKATEAPTATSTANRNATVAATATPTANPNVIEATKATSTVTPNAMEDASATGTLIEPVNATETTTRAKDAAEEMSLEKMYQKQIARAVLSQSHAGVLQKLWSDAPAAFKHVADGKIPPYVYDDFLSGFMVLYQSDKTTEVWNHMIANGTKPELRTWVALLNGCSKARDLNGLNAVWERMIRAGVEPDDYAWTTLIHGLISQRQINLAFNAMDEMGKKWLAAANPPDTPPRKLKGGRKLPPVKPSKATKTTNNHTKPSVEVVNAAIAGLVGIPTEALHIDKKFGYVHKVLQWAGHFNIKPDAYTYNTLIKLYVRANDHVTTFKLLRQMEADGIEGDAATHSMLVSAAFNNNKFEDLSESQQTTRIVSFFDELEAGGLKLNDYIYSNAIDRLLKLYGNVSAVVALMKHMALRNLTASSQIYTSLITHSFQQSPPDIPAVDALVAQIFGPPRAPTDKYLFDRIIEGYAHNGEVGKMMSVLTRMSSHGKQPGWPALTAVVKALAEAGDWERARAVVRDVQMGEGIAKSAVTGGLGGSKKFHAVVRSFGAGLEEAFDGEALQQMSTPAREGAVNGGSREGEGNEHLGFGGDGDLGSVPADAQQLYAGKETPLEDDVEFVNAEHAAYLSDEAEVSGQQWRPTNNREAGRAPA